MHDDAKAAKDWIFCHKEEGEEEIREVWGRKTPDSAFVPLPLQVNLQKMMCLAFHMRYM